MLIAFDFDGTIANTMPALTEAAVNFLVERTQLTREEALSAYLRTAGAPFSQQVAEIAPETYLDTFDFDMQKSGILAKAVPFDDVELAFTGLVLGGFKLAVVSSTVPILVTDWLLKNGLGVYLDQIYGFVAGYDKSAQLRSCGADVFVGDTNRDAEYAEKAGVEFIPIKRNGELCDLPNAITRLSQLFEMEEFSGKA